MTDDYTIGSTQITLGRDGMAPTGAIAPDLCCGSDIFCVSESADICGMMDLLPSGPMWDYAKSKTLEEVADAGGIPAGGFSCTTMASYAADLGVMMNHVRKNIIGQSIREACEFTAVHTLDDWLARYGWEDCYRSFCRSEYASTLSPYEGQLECGIGYFPTDFSEEFERALKHNILIALRRLRYAGIKKLSVINWIIEPLGAELRTPAVYPADVQAYLDDPSTCTVDCPPCFSGSIQLELHSISNELNGAPTEESFCSSDQPTPVNAEQSYTNGTDPAVLLRPGLFAAECIIRSMQPAGSSEIFIRT